MHLVKNKTIVATLALTAILSASALAQKGGGGGGGTTTTEVGTPLNVFYSPAIGGQVPTWTGTYSITPSIPGYYTWDTVSISIKGKPINLFDNTPMKIVAHFSDAVTGESLEEVSGPYFYCMKKVGTTKVTFTLYNMFGPVTRHLDGILVEDVQGNVLAAAHG